MPRKDKVYSTCILFLLIMILEASVLAVVFAEVGLEQVAGLVTDSLITYWRLEGSPSFNAVVMQSTADPDSFYADIPQQADFVNIEYYVQQRYDPTFPRITSLH
jgi:hypothetical protein